MEGFLSVHFCAPVDEAGDILDTTEKWGFVLTSADGEDTAFVSCGSRKAVKSFMKDYESLLALMIDTVRNSNNAMAEEMLDEALDNETGFNLNDVYYKDRQIRDEIAALGISA